MRSSLRLGHIRGVPVEVHWLFALLLAWAALQGWSDAGGWTILTGSIDLRAWFYIAQALYAGLRGALFAVGLLVLVFACVLVHEIGHTLHAQALGIPVRRIVLLPIGGLAELARLPERPRDELRVAIAGPAANVGLALIFGGLAFAWILAGDIPPREFLRLVWRGGAPPALLILLYLALTNVGITLFNLLPAFPMDGGRILRSLLALVFERLTATRIVSALSWVFGGAFILIGLGLGRSLGLPPNLGLVVVGLFTLIGSGVEKALEENRLALRNIVARVAVRQPTWTLSPTDVVTPGQAAFVFSLSGLSALPVVVGVRVVGLLTRRDVESALGRAGREAYTVAHLMRTRFPYVRADEDLWRAQQLLTTGDVGALPVVDGESLHGMLTSADIRAARFDPPPAFQVEAPTFIPGGNPTL
jgi:Zn-dependent protease